MRPRSNNITIESNTYILYPITAYNLYNKYIINYNSSWSKPTQRLMFITSQYLYIICN